jgi:hypothetical protein
MHASLYHEQDFEMIISRIVQRNSRMGDEVAQALRDAASLELII